MDSILLTNYLLFELGWLVVKSLHDFHGKLLDQIEVTVLTCAPEHVNEFILVHEVECILANGESKALLDFDLKYRIMVLEEGISWVSLHDQ